MREAINNPTIILKELQSSVPESKVKVNHSTISGALHTAGLYGRVARKKPFQKNKKNKHIKERLEFARYCKGTCFSLLKN